MSDDDRPPCAECDFIGPEEDTTSAAMRNLHREFHDLIGPLYPHMVRLSRWLDRLPRWMGFGR